MSPPCSSATSPTARCNCTDRRDACAFDEDLAAAAVTRKRVLTEATRRRAAVIPAHYPGHGGATVVARGDSFMVDDWLEITPI